MSKFLSEPAGGRPGFYCSAGSISSYSHSSVASEEDSNQAMPATESEEWPDSARAQVIAYEEHTPVVFTSTGTDPMHSTLALDEQEALLAVLRLIQPQGAMPAELLPCLREEVQALQKRIADLTAENSRLRPVQRKSRRTDNLLLTTKGQTLDFEVILRDLRTASRKASRALRVSAHRKKVSHQRSPVRLMGSVRLNLNPLLH